ncbi:malto-oligosyltrehalose trehalohydrolase [Cupriavidus plantarum]|uniref:malto-oligosyltrehalose trehalohydrolase n=1 Tax=Cupriavidus plantarum TaxID=942865 RepID=UPI000EAD1E7C|nr:malto-oligosyltrehalose trehalohydrolase [Cupriavidus plantarum]RLK39332.1 maltooligosyl trehalose hydrolase [Cupriavidus plantarum]
MTQTMSIEPTAAPAPPHANWETLGGDVRALPCSDNGEALYRFGPAPLADGRVRFSLWAPDAAAQGQSVRLEIAGMQPILMSQGDRGWFEAVTACCHGARYWFRLDDGTTIPDPASRAQAEDVHGASVFWHPSDESGYAWRHVEWTGRPWHEAVIYEMHVGLHGGFAGALRVLPRLSALGITAVELMPIAEFPGARNWGYDGVLPFAPEHAYGTPDQLREFVDTAHGLGMMVLLDVVYNHFGPEGNYLPSYASRFFREDRQTPWGPAIDFRQPEVRRFFTENARYWLEQFRFDGLRLDAVHAIEDEGWLPQMAEHLRQCLKDRHVHLVLENDHNDASLLRSGYDAQWNDDAHHALHVLLTGEHDGYYGEFNEDLPGTTPSGPGTPALRHLARVLGEGFAWQGETSPHRSGDADGPLQGREVRRGQPSGMLDATSFIMFLQNHDQTGNRAFGERLTTLADPDALRAAVALQLLSPQIPMIYMGEEDGAREPFLYFTDHPPELAQAVRDGRRREFGAAAAFSDESRAAQIPDPNAVETFEASRPHCDDTDGYCRAWHHYYGELLAIRRHEIVPRLAGTRSAGVEILGDRALVARWTLGDGSLLSIWLNLGDNPVPAQCEASTALHSNLLPGGIAALTGGELPPKCCVTCVHRAETGTHHAHLSHH